MKLAILAILAFVVAPAALAGPVSSNSEAANCVAMQAKAGVGNQIAANIKAAKAGKVEY